MEEEWGKDAEEHYCNTSNNPSSGDGTSIARTF
jgi:hypothetical protein